MEWILIWLAFAFLCGIIAPSRGRSGPAWFALGLLFSIFALVALLALPRHDMAPKMTDAEAFFARKAEREGTTLDGTPLHKTCPRCAEEVKYAAVVCRFCGHEFGEPQRDDTDRRTRSLYADRRRD